MRANRSKHSEALTSWIDLYNSGFSTTKIAKLYNTTDAVIYNNLKKQNVTIRNKKQAAQTNELHHNWKGQDASVNSIHRYVKARKLKPKFCDSCKTSPPKDLANVSPKYNEKTYTRDLANWTWQCRKCHMLSDGRMNNLKSTVSDTIQT